MIIKWQLDTILLSKFVITYMYEYVCFLIMAYPISVDFQYSKKALLYYIVVFYTHNFIDKSVEIHVILVNNYYCKIVIHYVIVTTNQNKHLNWNWGLSHSSPSVCPKSY